MKLTQLHLDAQEIIKKFHQETSYYNREYINRMNKLREDYINMLYDSLESYADEIDMSSIDKIINLYKEDL